MLNKIAARVLQFIRDRDDIDRLHMLDDHILRDMGISREEIDDRVTGRDRNRLPPNVGRGSSRVSRGDPFFNRRPAWIPSRENGETDGTNKEAARSV